MKKLFFILILIFTTQFVFASLPIWWDSDKSNINKKTVDLGAIYNSDKGKDTVDLNFRDISTDNSHNKPINAYFPTSDTNKDTVDYSNGWWLKDNSSNKPVNANHHQEDYDDFYWDYSTGMEGKDNVDLIRIRGKQLSAEQKNAKLERELILIILHTPGNTENNDSKYLKIKKVIKEKLHDLICWAPDDLGD